MEREIRSLHADFLFGFFPFFLIVPSIEKYRTSRARRNINSVRLDRQYLRPKSYKARFYNDLSAKEIAN